MGVVEIELMLSGLVASAFPTEPCCWPQKAGLTFKIIIMEGKLFKTNWPFTDTLQTFCALNEKVQVTTKGNHDG